MRRRPLNLLAILSLSACAAVCMLWARSYRHYDALGFWPSPAEPRAYGVLSDSGTFYLVSIPEGDPGAPRRWKYFAAPAGRGLGSTAGGFAYRRDSRSFLLGSPYWLVCAVLTLSASVSAWRARSKRRRRTALGLCPSCGYDLRATPERCPECGNAVAVHLA